MGDRHRRHQRARHRLTHHLAAVHRQHSAEEAAEPAWPPRARAPASGYEQPPRRPRSTLDSGSHDETRSCGTQPAHISLTARRAPARTAAPSAEPTHTAGEDPPARAWHSLLHISRWRASRRSDRRSASAPPSPPAGRQPLIFRPSCSLPRRRTAAEGEVQRDATGAFVAAVPVITPTEETGSFVRDNGWSALSESPSCRAALFREALSSVALSRARHLPETRRRRLCTCMASCTSRKTSYRNFSRPTRSCSARRRTPAVRPVPARSREAGVPEGDGGSDRCFLITCSLTPRQCHARRGEAVQR